MIGYKSLIAALSGLVLLGLLSCTPAAIESKNRPQTTQASEKIKQATPITDEVPQELMEAILKDLSENEHVDQKTITVTRAETVIWSDGALGCPKPGEMYTHALVPGYWIVLKSGGQQYDYRASQKGFFRRCKGSFRLQLPVG